MLRSKMSLGYIYASWLEVGKLTCKNKKQELR